MPPLSDLTAEVFYALRNAFFDERAKPKPFSLRAKRNTQDDPLDEYVTTLLAAELRDATCQKAAGPLISPDLVVYRPEACTSVIRDELRTDTSRVVAIEVKKVERTRSGQVARSTGMDYNTTPPCGTVRVYDIDDQGLDISAFYLFVCQESRRDGGFELSALVLCDGNVLNADFELYLQITGQRTKGLGLGTYGDGVNRNRPMLIFANPLGAAQLDQHCTWIAARNHAQIDDRFRYVYEIGRTLPEGGQGIFYAYRLTADGVVSIT